ncbi:imidazole glycerol phosphate synthase subunit HisH [Lachnospiraceae bacterium ZAX-1]
MIAIIDYDAGNLMSVQKALDYMNEVSIITRNPKEILLADKIILPGVGAFGDAMENLKKFEMDKVIKEAVSRQIPLLGICLGLQLLFAGSEENGGVEGLNLLPGAIIKFPQIAELKIPHMGWNSLKLKGTGRLFTDLPDDSFVYFVHSYYLKAEDPAIVKALTDYGVPFHASVEYGNLFGCQFHPEKSSDTGLHILKNFAKMGNKNTCS